MGNSTQLFRGGEVYEHPRLGSVIVSKEGQHSYIHHSRKVESNLFYEEWRQSLHYVMKDEVLRESLFLPINQSFTPSSFCGGGGILKMKFKEYLSCLTPEVSSRRLIRRHFSESELLYLFYTIVKLKTVLQQYNSCIGDVKPENLLINEEGLVSVISQYSWPNQKLRVLEAFGKPEERYFLSPEECDPRKKYQQDSFSTSENFSVALTILEAGTLIDCSAIYGPKGTYTFWEPKLKEIIDAFGRRYSQGFTHYIRDMLQPNPKKRLRAALVYEALCGHQLAIFNLEPININDCVDTLNISCSQKEGKISMRKKALVYSLTEQDLSRSFNFERLPSPVYFHKHHEEPQFFSAYASQPTAQNSQGRTVMATSFMLPLRPVWE